MPVRSPTPNSEEAELIEVDDLGFARIKGDGLVPTELGEKARLAVKSCPEYALRLVTAKGHVA